jgi:hypothetical protein
MLIDSIMVTIDGRQTKKGRVNGECPLAPYGLQDQFLAHLLLFDGHSCSNKMQITVPTNNPLLKKDCNTEGMDRNSEAGKNIIPAPSDSVKPNIRVRLGSSGSFNTPCNPNPNIWPNDANKAA